MSTIMHNENTRMRDRRDGSSSGKGSLFRSLMVILALFMTFQMMLNKIILSTYNMTTNRDNHSGDLSSSLSSSSWSLQKPPVVINTPSLSTTNVTATIIPPHNNKPPPPPPPPPTNYNDFFRPPMPHPPPPSSPPNNCTDPYHGTPPFWKNSPTLPSWIKTYFHWHATQRCTAHPHSSSHKYLVIPCLSTASKCGGLADRLRSLPTYLLFAHLTKRILLIQWERPRPLEDFLLPTANGGIDWRVPSQLVVPDRSNITDLRLVLSHSGMRGGKGAANRLMKEMPGLPQHRAVSYLFGAFSTSQMEYHIVNVTESQVLLCSIQAGDGGRPFFERWSPIDDNTAAAAASFDNVMGELYRAMFTPSPPVTNLIREAMTRLELVPGEYGSVHTRPRYGHGTIDKEGGHHEVKDFVLSHRRQTMNALHCLFEVSGGSNNSSSSSSGSTNSSRTIFFASDSDLVSRFVTTESPYATSNAVRVVTTAAASSEEEEIKTEPVHFDTNSFRSIPTERFYPIFVDLYILALGRCISYGLGGFGELASMISLYPDCAIRHRVIQQKILRVCSVPEFLKGDVRAWRKRGV